VFLGFYHPIRVPHTDDAHFSRSVADDNLEVMREFLAGEPSVDEIDAQLAKMQFSIGIAAYEKICLYFFAAFDTNIIKSKQIHKNKEPLKKLVSNPTVQMRLIACCERLFGGMGNMSINQLIECQQKPGNEGPLTGKSQSRVYLAGVCSRLPV
jgi:hypothetical protein